MRLIAPVALGLTLCSPTMLASQSYRPSYNDRLRPEVVVVYLAATTYAPCRAPWMASTLDSMKVQVQRQARARNRAFAAVFVAMDWYVDSALALARASGEWDELVVGRNWANSGAQLYIWADTSTAPAMPQILVLEEERRPGARLELTSRRIVRRVRGADAIRQWVAAGSPVLPN